MNDKGNSSNLIQIGFITRPHGIRGEVKVNYFFEEPEKIRTLKRVYVCLKSAVCKEMEVVSLRPQGSNVILNLKDIYTRNDAETLRGSELFVQKEMLPDLDEGQYYMDEIIGLKVKNLDNEYLGEIIDVLKLPMQEVYVIENQGIESLVPAVEEFVKKIDVTQGEMIIDPIDGMFNQDEN